MQGLITALAEAAAAGQVTGRITLFISGRRVDGELAAESEWFNANSNALAEIVPQFADVELFGGEPRLYLRDVADSNGERLSWLVVDPASVQAFSMEPVPPATARGETLGVWLR